MVALIHRMSGYMHWLSLIALCDDLGTCRVLGGAMDSSEISRWAGSLYSTGVETNLGLPGALHA